MEERGRGRGGRGEGGVATRRCVTGMVVCGRRRASEGRKQGRQRQNQK